MSKWLHNNQEVNDLSYFPENAVGFVYKITNKINGKIYIGKKVLFNNLSKPLTKKEIAEWQKPGRVPKKKKIKKESNWVDYHGSNKNLQEDVIKLGADSFDKEILTICFTKKSLTYYEEYYQFSLRVLHYDTYNDHIAGRYFKRDVKQEPEDTQSHPVS